MSETCGPLPYPGRQHRFRHRQRIRNERDFHTIRKKGRRYDCRAFILQISFVDKDRLPEDHKATVSRRIGVIASRKVGNAVSRNRVKRLFREIFRQTQDQLPRQCDIVVVARKAVLDIPFSDVQALYNKGVRKIVENKGKNLVKRRKRE